MALIGVILAMIPEGIISIRKQQINVPAFSKIRFVTLNWIGTLSIIQIKDSTENAQSIIKKVKMKFEIAPPMNPSSVLLGLKLISFVLPKLLPAKKREK